MNSSFCPVENDLPVVTVIIPARPGEADVKAAAAARRLNYPPEKLEILLARGRQPSVQRNKALKVARGEIIYFLDDDSVPDPDNLRRAVRHFSRPEVKMVGGPNLCPPEAPPREQAFARAMGTWLAFGPSRSRYCRTGTVRDTSEKELILCNLLARKNAVLALGGFDETLYPNEENALMDGLQEQGGKLVYDPEIAVNRRPRPTWKAFIKMLFNYGRGRAEQFRMHPSLGSMMNFVPPLFCVYLLAIAFLPTVFLWPLAIYFLAVLAQAAAVLPLPNLTWMPRVMLLILLSHIFYGLGFWRGLVTRPKAPSEKTSAEVVLEKIL